MSQGVHCRCFPSPPQAGVTSSPEHPGPSAGNPKAKPIHYNDAISAVLGESCLLHQSLAVFPFISQPCPVFLSKWSSLSIISGDYLKKRGA